MDNKIYSYLKSLCLKLKKLSLYKLYKNPEQITAGVEVPEQLEQSYFLVGIVVLTIRYAVLIDFLILYFYLQENSCDSIESLSSIKIVLGNESCDLDSAVSSVAYACFLDHEYKVMTVISSFILLYCNHITFRITRVLLYYPF